MNSVKKATGLISPDPFITARRSSLPLPSLDFGTGESSISDIVKLLKLSSQNLVQLEHEFGKVPKIVFEGPRCSSRKSSDGNLSFSLSPFLNAENLLSPFSPLDGQNSVSKGVPEAVPDPKREANRRRLSRRASCGATFSFNFSSPDQLLKTTNNLTKRVSASQCKNASPRFQFNIPSPRSEELPITKNKEKVLDESPSNRSQSFLHCPSLSPCFEDKPKINSFPFSKLSENTSLQNCDKLNQTTCNDLCSKRANQFSYKGRRASIHDFISQSPRMPQNGVLRCSNSQLRRKSFDASSINLPECLNNVGELERGNDSLLRNSRLLDVDSIIGRGGFGIVKVGLWKGEKVAVKIIRGGKAAKSRANEEKSLNFSSHLNLVGTKAIIVPEDSINARIYSNLKEEPRVEPIKNLQSLLSLSDKFKYGIKTSKSYWSIVISELCTPTNLLKLINSNASILDIDKLRILRQIASALNYMHSFGFVHLDVKPANCFLTPTGIVKLGDFGCASKIDEIPTQSLGTISYQAPEALRGGTVTDRCDIYSLGVTTWQMVCRETPFAGYHPHVIIYKVTRMDHRPSSQKHDLQTSFIESALLTIAKRCWSRQPDDRPSAGSFIRIVASLFFSST